MAEQWNPFRVSPGLMSYEDMWRWAPQARTPGVGGLLQNQLDPDIVKRGMMLPWGRTRQGEMEFAVPEVLLSLARSARLPGRVAQGYPWTPEDVTEMALNVAGTGYLGGGLLTGVPKGAVLGANVWHGGPNRWMPEPGYPQGRPLLSRVGTGEGAQAYGHGFYSAEAPGVARSVQESTSGFDQLTLHTKAGKKAGDALDDVDLEVAKYLEVGAKDAGQFPHNTVYYAKQNAEKAGDKAALKRLDEYGPDARMSYERNYGSLKKLDIPDEDIAKFLDWDAPLSGKDADGVIAALGDVRPVSLGNGYYGLTRVGPDGSGQIIQGINEASPEAAKAMLKATFTNIKGADAYRTLSGLVGGDEAASAALRKAGIPGLKYYDQMSRQSVDLFVDGKVRNPLSARRIAAKEHNESVGQLVSHGSGAVTLGKDPIEAIMREAKYQAGPHGTGAPSPGDISAAIKFMDRIKPHPKTRNYVTWDQDVLNRTRILASGGE